MGDDKLVGLNPDAILGAAKATQFLFAELVVALGYGEHFSERIKFMEHTLMEKGLVNIDDGTPSMNSEEFPYYIEGIRSSLQHVSALIDDKLDKPKELPESQPQLVPKSSFVSAEVEEP